MNNQEFLTLGTHCSDPTCNQLDFLPFKCSCCQLPFCQLHWKPEIHNCTKYDPYKADNRIPSCPLCNTPISFPPSVKDPNIPMEHHFNTTCPILNPSPSSTSSSTTAATGIQSKKKQPTNECNYVKCKQKMVIPFDCQKCGKKFCASHRFEGDHLCSGPTSSSATGGGGPTNGVTAGTGGVPKGKEKALAALKKYQQSLATKQQQQSKPPLKGKGTKQDPIIIPDSDNMNSTRIKSEAVNPSGTTGRASAMKGLEKVGIVTNKVDQRAREERMSAMKGLELRASKGLLSEEEKIKYATMKAVEARNGGGGSGGKKGKDGCILS